MLNIFVYTHTIQCTLLPNNNNIPFYLRFILSNYYFKVVSITIRRKKVIICQVTKIQKNSNFFVSFLYISKAYNKIVNNKIEIKKKSTIP